MSKSFTTTKRQPFQRLIVVLSVLIPLLVAALFKIPKIKGYDTSMLPSIYATINGLTAVLLISAVLAIKKGKRTVHERLVKTCMGLSVCFLILYVVYHLTSETTSFAGTGVIKYLYLFILFTHILLSVVVIPFVLFTYARAHVGNFDGHRALARFTFPLWLYVAISGVVVYLMISPYYA